MPKKPTNMYDHFLRCLPRIYRPTVFQRICSTFSDVLLAAVPLRTGTEAQGEPQPPTVVELWRLRKQMANSEQSKVYEALTPDELQSPELISVDRMEAIADEIDVPTKAVRHFVDWVRSVKNDLDGKSIDWNT